ELEGLSELERYQLFRKARKRLYSQPEGYFMVTAYGAAAVGFALAVQQLGPFFLGSSLWSVSISSLVGLSLAMHFYDRWYANHLRGVVQSILREQRSSTDQPPA
ncbi:MAG: hypothetical protein ACOCVP_04920, partial [Wenzhouxiangella sp.]